MIQNYNKLNNNIFNCHNLKEKELYYLINLFANELKKTQKVHIISESKEHFTKLDTSVDHHNSYYLENYWYNIFNSYDLSYDTAIILISSTFFLELSRDKLIKSKTPYVFLYGTHTRYNPKTYLITNNQEYNFLLIQKSDFKDFIPICDYSNFQRKYVTLNKSSILL